MMRRTTYRRLRPGEEPPPGEPKRYTSDKRGYIRLRWKVGPAEYVETYEHRLIAGMPDGDVHHGNEVKDDNDPGNLHTLSKSAHAQHHAAEAHRNSKAVTDWGGMRSQEAYNKRQRRMANVQARQALLLEVAQLYRQGLSTTEIGERIGRAASNVSRMLRQAGVVPGPPGKTKRRPGNPIPSDARQVVHARSGMRCERCGANLVWTAGHVHHRQPRTTVNHVASNLLYLCMECHGWVHGHPQLSREDGWLVSRYDDPAEIPVLHHSLGLVFLTANGDIIDVDGNVVGA